MSYTNGCVSEYVACHIFGMLGFRVQETLLGNYTDSRGKKKLVVACRDFTEGGKKLMEFAHLKNTCIDSEQNGYGKELSSILETINEQTLYPADELRTFFWDMFIADAFLGNFDRHNGNWGLLVEEEKQLAEIAPIYDCGSCLYPQLDLERMKYVLESEEEIDRRVYVFPASSIEENGVKIPYSRTSILFPLSGIRSAMMPSRGSVQELIWMRSSVFWMVSRSCNRSRENFT